MRNEATKAIALSLAFFVYGAPVEAHTFGAEGAGLLDGVVHPFIGVDHLLAMLAVGIWAVQSGGAAIWRVPLFFVGLMVFSALMAAYGPVVPMLEIALALSVLILGGLVLCAARLPIGLESLLIGLLAITHGYAHGLEAPEAGSALFYGMGFVVSTVLLLLMGSLLGVIARRNHWLTKAGGLAIAVTGLYLTTVVA